MCGLIVRLVPQKYKFFKHRGEIEWARGGSGIEMLSLVTETPIIHRSSLISNSKNSGKFT